MDEDCYRRERGQTITFLLIIKIVELLIRSFVKGGDIITQC